ncbi:MAG: hypothetical protein GXP27_19210 [Planctomycetes bacterium]|nr:hypothetical protein [Planctomycetota bacterium]
MTNRTYNRQDNLVSSIDVPGYPGLSFSYSYDENKNVTAETTCGVTAGYSWTASYDAEDRLISWQRQNGDSQSWTLTLVGDWQQFVENGTTQTRTDGPTHELLAVDSDWIMYDARGNMLSITDFHSALNPRPATSLVGDFDNMFASATVSASAAEVGQGIEGTHRFRSSSRSRHCAAAFIRLVGRINEVGAQSAGRR